MDSPASDRLANHFPVEPKTVDIKIGGLIVGTATITPEGKVTAHITDHALASGLAGGAIRDLAFGEIRYRV